MAESAGLPFHHVPVTADSKPQAEATLLELVEQYQADLVVLARYMQVLSDDLCTSLHGRAINIHHSSCQDSRAPGPISRHSTEV